MTTRRGVRVGFAAAALVLGSLALPELVVAAPRTAPATVVTGSDPLAATAAAALDALAAGARSEFGRLRDLVATEAAARTEADPAAMRAAWRQADRPHQVAVLAAFTQLGTPYRTNASMPGEGFDCSGLTAWSWQQAGVALFHQSKTQIREATPLSAETAQAGDLVYYPGHVMMFLGVGPAMIHSPFSGRTVEVFVLPARRVGRVKYGNPAPPAPAQLRVDRPVAVA